MIVALVGAALVAEASAHGVSGKDALFLQSIHGAAIGPLMYLGAKHMVTGYDHLAFLIGVIFFLYRLKDIVQYVSLFTIGHSLTLQVSGGEVVLGQWQRILMAELDGPRARSLRVQIFGVS